MNLVNGKIISLEESFDVVDNISQLIVETLENEFKLDYKIVINACNQLVSSFDKSDFISQFLNKLNISNYNKSYVDSMIDNALFLLSKDFLEHKVLKELGPDPFIIKKETQENYEIEEQLVPLGVLFHIAASNMNGLPFFTLIEGLLSGNINIIKLPTEEGGLTIKLAQKLIEIEPRLAPFIYIFDYSSKDVTSIAKLLNVSDAVVVWGGDAAIKAIRNIAPLNTKIIEWGHKVSFAYVDDLDCSDQELERIALGICLTNQELCSSTQGIYLNTLNDFEVDAFCLRFIKILNEVSVQYPFNNNIFLKAKVGLNQYTEMLEDSKSKVYRLNDVSITSYLDSDLEISNMFRNVWVKKLSKNDIIKTLKPYKNYLQSLALVTKDQNLKETFYKIGIDSISDGANMQLIYKGFHHDGEYPLRRYTKTVCYTKRIM